MRRFARLMILMGISALTGACNFFAQPGDYQTESLQNEVAQTQIAAVRATATVNADRLLVTLDSAETAVGNVNLQSTRIASTLIASGMAFVDASAITPVAPTEAVPEDASTPFPQVANPLLTPGVPQVSSEGSAQGDSLLVQPTPTTALNPPTIDPNSPSLTNISLSEQVGSDDCALNPATSFSVSATDIYVVATANNIQANTELVATFARDGQIVQTYPWTPGFAMNGVCFWFHLPASEVEFVPGNWSVVLTVNGTAASTPIPFTIGEASPNEINVTPETGG
jgi:hypothetical protein